MLSKKEDILLWLKNKNINAYSIKNNNIVNVFEDVKLDAKGGCNYIPVQFGFIEGNFDCSEIGLTTLLGCPHEVKGNFTCNLNKLTTLKYCPAKIGNTFDCSENQLTSLEYMPNDIQGFFDCSYNLLENLKYCPLFIPDCLMCHHNKLTTFEGFPEKVDGSLFFEKNYISYKELINFNTNVGEDIYSDFAGNTSLFLDKINTLKNIILEKNTLLEIKEFNHLIDGKKTRL